MKMKTFIRSFVFLAFLALVASPAWAAYDMYLKIEGPVIEGESTAPGYTNQMQILSYSQGIQVPISSGTNGPQAGPPQASDVSVVKVLDKGSPLLLLNCNQGTHIGKMTLSFVQSGAAGGLIYTIYMEDVLISSVQHSGSTGGDTRPTEAFSFNFRRIRWTYYPTPGSQAGKVETGWDYVANAPF